MRSRIKQRVGSAVVRREERVAIMKLTEPDSDGYTHALVNKAGDVVGLIGEYLEPKMYGCEFVGVIER